MATNSETEQLRLAAREVLAARPGVAFKLPAIRKRIVDDALVDHAFTDEELRGALSFLIADGQMKVFHGDLGATEYFEATAVGILKFERAR